MLNLSGTLHNHNDLNMTEGMKARVHSRFYGRKISYETILYLPEILGQFLGKGATFLDKDGLIFSRVPERHQRHKNELNQY